RLLDILRRTRTSPHHGLRRVEVFHLRPLAEIRATFTHHAIVADQPRDDDLVQPRLGARRHYAALLPREPSSSARARSMSVLFTAATVPRAPDAEVISARARSMSST